MGYKIQSSKAVKFAQRRERKLANLFQRSPSLKNNRTFDSIRTRFQENADKQFALFSDEHYNRLKSNVKYVQQCSGLNVQEFCAAFNLGHNIISNKENKYSFNIRQQTFLKIYSAFIIYIPTVDLFDMFTMDFRQCYPHLVEVRQKNRELMGKRNGRPRKRKY